MSLFEEAAPDPLAPAPDDAPLADRMRPRSLAEVHGQSHLLGEGKILSRAFREGLRQSLILWGPPGIGKTSLARLLAAAGELRFVTFSAVLSGVKEVRVVMQDAEARRRQKGTRTLLFIDEIHRFNKAQQDAFLPYVERGDVVLVGATTENPSFEVNAALLSRCRVLMLQPLSPDEAVDLLAVALADERGFGGRIEANRDQLAALAHASDGDARRALTLLETAANLIGDAGTLTEEALREALAGKALRYDKSGEEHYNLISALHKSIRNSDANATVYWLTRMMHAGEDGNYLARRLIRIASEDIGLADPFALRVALDAGDAFSRLGYPEGNLALVQAAVYLARARKSNALYVALGEATRDVESTNAEPVPLHLRNASTALMKDAGYGEGYRYAHDDPAAVNEMDCLPDSLRGRQYLKGVELPHRQVRRPTTRTPPEEV
ncbi:MAG: replication-associated recombination protein A [Planctomycetota bacterium]|nr:replication-associated recombination protein A [Planctomycetota bacterium]